MNPLFYKFLGDFVYGATDGIITTFSIVAGSEGAEFPSKVVVILGIANLVADGLSMGVSNFLAKKAEMEAVLKLDKDHHFSSPIFHGIVTFFAFAVVGFLPLIPYIFFSNFQNRFLLALIGALLSFLLVGFLRGIVLREKILKNILEILTVGIAASGIAYLIGNILGGII